MPTTHLISIAWGQKDHFTKNLWQISRAIDACYVRWAERTKAYIIHIVGSQKDHIKGPEIPSFPASDFFFNAKNLSEKKDFKFNKKIIFPINIHFDKMNKLFQISPTCSAILAYFAYLAIRSLILMKAQLYRCRALTRGGARGSTLHPPPKC